MLFDIPVIFNESCSEYTGLLWLSMSWRKRLWFCTVKNKGKMTIIIDDMVYYCQKQSGFSDICTQLISVKNYIS